MTAVTLVDATSQSAASIAVGVGFNCFAFLADVNGTLVDVLDAPPDFASGGQRPSSGGIPLLFPYPNRIRGGRYAWDGREYRLPADRVACDSAGNAIHGFCLDRPWRITGQGDYFVAGQFRLSADAPDRLDLWPADFVIEVRYELRGPNLRADVLIVNPDDKPLPWGFGTHPYFKLPLGPDSDPARCTVRAPADEQWDLIDCLPTGRRYPVPDVKDLRAGAYFPALTLDDVYTAVKSDADAVECGIVDEAAGLELVQRCDPSFREIVAYTPPHRRSVCLEPYTCVTDAVNLQSQGVDAGWRTLAPGETFQTWIEIRVRPVVA